MSDSSVKTRPADPDATPVVRIREALIDSMFLVEHELREATDELEIYAAAMLLRSIVDGLAALADLSVCAAANSPKSVSEQLYKIHVVATSLEKADVDADVAHAAIIDLLNGGSCP